NDNFELNKGKLPWPVVGDVKLKFGRYEYYLSEKSKPLIDDNPGVTFSTNPGTPVKAVFKGEVAGVSRLADEVIVVIRHGKYFTTYSNLTGVTVKKGDQVSQGQVLGRAGNDDEGNGGKIDFILMDESKNVNPEIWLRRK
ncbi:MAG: M23 family metallopeptidase, partial [Chitinophagaceae bacterium]|nr:M23 family metallopeptidase [Chitinophagaceae bacterium]